jgi:LEA14-like dessication related protein
LESVETPHQLGKFFMRHAGLIRSGARAALEEVILSAMQDVQSRCTWIVPALVLGMLALGCASTPLSAREVLAPDVFLTDVAPIGGGLFEQRIQLTFRVTNLNDFDLPIEGGSFDLTINDAPFARGVSRERVVVPALGEVLVKTEASTTTLGLLNQLRDLSNKRELRYMLSGRFSLDGLHVKSVAFERAADLGPVPFWGDRPAE